MSDRFGEVESRADWDVDGSGKMTDKQRRMLMDELSYDPITGLFHWRKSGRGRSKREGEVAGCPHSNGYLRIKVCGTQYLAHRLAWLFVHGAWPVHEVDHVNRDRADNRLANLRAATVSENRRNTVGIPSRRQSKFKGVSLGKGYRRWSARIFVGGVLHKIGLFDTEAEAAEAYREAAARLHGVFAP